MAIKKEINIKVDAKSAIKETENLAESFKGVDEEVIPLRKQIRNLEAELQSLAEAGKENSQEFLEGAEKLRSYNKELKNANESVDKASQSVGENLKGSFEGVSDTIDGASNVMGAFGVDTEAVEGALGGMKTAMEFADGVESVKSGMKAFKGLKNAIMASTVVQKILNVVMSLNPIGLIIIGVTALIALVVALFQPIQDIMNAWFGVAEAEESAEEMNERLNESYAETVKLLDRIIDRAVNNQKRKLELMKLEGKSEKDLHKERLKLIRIERQGAKEKLELEKAFINDKKVAYKKALQEEDFEKAKSIRKDIEGSREKYKDLIDQDKDFRHQLKIENLQFQKDQDADAKQKRADRRAKYKAYQDKLKQAAADRLAAERAIEDAEQELKEEGRETDLENARIANRRKLEDLRLDKSLEKDELKELERLAQEELKQQELEINAKFNKIKDDQDTIDNDKRIAKEDAQFQLGIELMKNKQAQEEILLAQSYDKKFELAAGNAELEKQLTEQQGEDLEAIQEKYRKIAEEKDKEAADKKKEQVQNGLDAAMSGLTALQGLGDAITEAQLAKAGDDEEKKEKIRKKAFERNKKMQIVMAIVQGIQGTMAAFTAGSSMGPAGVVMGPLMAALAAATALANIAKIKNTKFESSNAPKPDTGRDAGSVAAAGPQFNVVGASSENQLAQTLGDQQPIQAYVVAGDVTTAQSLERDKIENASL